MGQNYSKFGMIGGIIASILASACCIGPIIFAVLGLSSAGILSQFESIRPIMIIVSLVFIGLAFYQTYKKPSLDKCIPESICSKPNSKIINKIILWCVLIFILGIMTFPYWSLYLV